MEAISLLAAILIVAILLGIALGATLMRALYYRSPVDRMVNRRHFGGV